MPISARALGQTGLRLRSRRVRAGQSRHRSIRSALPLLAIIGLIGFGDVSVRASDFRLFPFTSAAVLPDATALMSPAFALDDQDRRYRQQWGFLDAQLQAAVGETGMLAASYGAGQIDSVTFEDGLRDTRAVLHELALQVVQLEPPIGFQPTHERFVSTIGSFEHIALELQQAVATEDERRLVSAVSLSLETSVHLRRLGDAMIGRPRVGGLRAE